MASLPKWIDAEMPFRGPCGFCGSPDARHRVTDAIWGAIKAGDPVKGVAYDYVVSEAFAERLGRRKTCP